MLAELRSGAAAGCSKFRRRAKQQCGYCCNRGCAPKRRQCPVVQALHVLHRIATSQSPRRRFCWCGSRSVPPARARSDSSLRSAEPPTAVTAEPAAAKRRNREKTPRREFDGISKAQVAEIKAAIQSQQKFLGEFVEHGSRWELDGAELRIYFPPERRTFAEMIEGRDSTGKDPRHIRARYWATRCASVLNWKQSGSGMRRARASGTQELRAQFEQDPIVRAMLQRFGGRISEVKRGARGVT